MAVTANDPDSFSTVTTSSTTSDSSSGDDNSSYNNSTNSTATTISGGAMDAAAAAAAAGAMLSPFRGEYLLVWDYTQRCRPLILHDYGNPAVNDKSNARSIAPPRLTNVGRERCPFPTGAVAASAAAATANALPYASIHALTPTHQTQAGVANPQNSMLNYFNHNHAANVIGGFKYHNAVQTLQQRQQQQQQQQQQQKPHQLKRKGPAMGFDGDLQPSLKKYAAMLSPQTALAMAASAAAAAATVPGSTAETETRLDGSAFCSQEPAHSMVKTSSPGLNGPVATLPPLARKGAPLLPLLNPPLTLVPSYHPLQHQQQYTKQHHYYSPGSTGFTTPPSQPQPQQHYHSIHHQHLHQQFHQQLQQLQQQQQQQQQQKQQQQQQQKKQQQRPQKSEAPKKPPRTLYCENCNEHFTNLDAHTQGPRHTAFVANEANFQSLDNVIRKLGRRSVNQGPSSDCFFDYLSNSLA
ncbi:Hypothetical protein, no similarity [Geotrichum candidum]|uniref:DBF4-type domain-containing protein n=1 Tax=Geotrichum candidum TaxID=1173061 RepID=A0A0J9XCB8_GEOCN|nr:Hypothetical protein, no similarity [Geotrichum candidum]